MLNVRLKLGFLLLLAPLFAVADSYHVTVFAYRGAVLNTAAKSHTYAMFQRSHDGRLLDSVEISWLPDENNFAGLFENRMPIFRVVRGRNYTFHETQEIARGFGYPVCRYGPYPTTAELYERAVAQRQRLESGVMRYKMLDWGFNRWAINCIHAVAEVIGNLDTGIRRGPGASREVARFFHRRGYIPALVTDEAALHGALNEVAAIPPGP